MKENIKIKAITIYPWSEAIDGNENNGNHRKDNIFLCKL